MYDVCRSMDGKFQMDRVIKGLDRSSDVPLCGGQLLLGSSD
jgi:hypothetical protein